jgi:hypothetical protein
MALGLIINQLELPGFSFIWFYWSDEMKVTKEEKVEISTGIQSNATLDIKATTGQERVSLCLECS